MEPILTRFYLTAVFIIKFFLKLGVYIVKIAFLLKSKF